MQFTKKNVSARKFKGRSNRKQRINWQQQEGTRNYTNQNFVTNNEWHAPQTNSYYNPHYANYPHVNNYVRSSPYNADYQQIWKPTCSKCQDSAHLPINPHRLHHNNYSQQRFHPYQKINNSGRHFNTFQPSAFINNARREHLVGRSTIEANGNNSQQINNRNRNIINSHLRAIPHALSTSSSGYSSSSSPAPSTCSEFSLDRLAELPEATLQTPDNMNLFNNRNAEYVKSDLVYDIESNSLILTKPYEIVDAPIALAPM